MSGPMRFFAAATLLPVALIAAGALAGGVWPWLALGYMTVFTAAADRLIARTLPTAPPEAEFPVADALSAVLALAQFALLALTVRALATGIAGVPLFLAMALFAGQVGNSNAHELIHRGSRLLRGLGMWAYVSVLFGHHTSAHVLVHHIRVATRGDPNSARPGESLYRFIPRAWRGSFREGFRAESERLARVGRPWWRHPYVTYLGGAALMLFLAALIGGWRGLAWYVPLALFAQAQLLMSDYVQHYGLARALRPDGKPEPVAPRHSWNSPHPASSALMLNAPRHSDHHGHPTRPYPALTLPPDAPMLPRSLPVMATLALVPPLWRRVMDPRAARWQG